MIHQVRHLYAESHAWPGNDTRTLLSPTLLATGTSLLASTTREAATRKSSSSLWLRERIRCLTYGLLSFLPPQGERFAEVQIDIVVAWSGSGITGNTDWPIV